MSKNNVVSIEKARVYNFLESMKKKSFVEILQVKHEIKKHEKQLLDVMKKTDIALGTKGTKEKIKAELIALSLRVSPSKETKQEKDARYSALAKMLESYPIFAVNRAIENWTRPRNNDKNGEKRRFFPAEYDLMSDIDEILREVEGSKDDTVFLLKIARSEKVFFNEEDAKLERMAIVGGYKRRPENDMYEMKRKLEIEEKQRLELAKDPQKQQERINFIDNIMRKFKKKY